MPVEPVSVIIFGSFARRQADRHSDIDALIVRRNDIDEDNREWSDGVEGWRHQVGELTGNAVEVVEVSFDDALARLTDPSTLWRDIQRDGTRVYGASIDELQSMGANA